MLKHDEVYIAFKHSVVSPLGVNFLMMGISKLCT